MIMFLPYTPLPPETKIGTIITLFRIHEEICLRPQHHFLGVTCNEKGDIRTWNREEEAPDRTGRDNRHHCAIQGLDQGRLDFEGKTLVRFNAQWYMWTFHPHGVLLCYPDRLDLVVLPLET